MFTAHHWSLGGLSKPGGLKVSSQETWMTRSTMIIGTHPSLSIDCKFEVL